MDWKTKQDNELFIDFETMSDIFSEFNNLPEQPCTEMIFMIGASWFENGKSMYTKVLFAMMLL